MILSDILTQVVEACKLEGVNVSVILQISQYVSYTVEQESHEIFSLRPKVQSLVQHSYQHLVYRLKYLLALAIVLIQCPVTRLTGC